MNSQFRTQTLFTNASCSDSQWLLEVKKAWIRTCHRHAQTHLMTRMHQTVLWGSVVCLIQHSNQQLAIQYHYFTLAHVISTQHSPTSLPSTWLALHPFLYDTKRHMNTRPPLYHCTECSGKTGFHLALHNHVTMALHVHWLPMLPDHLQTMSSNALHPVPVMHLADTVVQTALSVHIWDIWIPNLAAVSNTRNPRLHFSLGQCTSSHAALAVLYQLTDKEVFKWQLKTVLFHQAF